MDKKKITNHLIIYFVLSFCISWLLWASSVINTQFVKVPEILLLFSQFAILGPLFAAMIMRTKEDGKAGLGQLFKDAWNFKFKIIWLVPTLLLPAIMIAVTLAIKLPIEGKALTFAQTPAPLIVFAIILLFIGGPLEEFGWRGYALPNLLKLFSFLPAALIVGLFHGLWHLPLHFMAGTVQSAMPIWEFVAVTAVGAVIYAWIYVNTNGNLLLMIVHHWAGNLSAALMVYWDTTLGRWIFFGVQLLVVFSILLVCRKNPPKKINFE